MEDAELEKIVDAWFAYTEADRKSPARDENWWAVEEVSGWTRGGEEEVEKLWRFIVAAYKREASDLAMASLAAGPVEELLAYHGPGYVDRVVELARRQPRFNWLLGGVWHSSIKEEVWQRVQAIRNYEDL